MTAPAPLRLDHVVVPVDDAEAARRFYGIALGLPLVSALSGDDWGGRRWLMLVFGLGTGGQHIVATVFEGVEAAPPGLLPRDARHNAFAVDSIEEWNAWHERLEEAGVDWWKEDHGVQQSLYVADPSGNVLEITTPETPSFGPEREPAEAVVERWLRRR